MIINEFKKFGINRAEIQDATHLKLFENQVRNGNKDATCIFISHRSTDKNAAVAIADYIKECGIDVYIDLDDVGLQIATVKNDPQSIVEHIHKGLQYSTHILALISDDTRESWWVPYEIGYGKKAGKEVASLLLKQEDVDFFPDYLKIAKRIFSANEFIEYINGIMRVKHDLILIENPNSIINVDITSVQKYIKNVKK